MNKIDNLGKKIRVGVIGVGIMGNYHARIYSMLSDICDFIGVYDIQIEMAKDVALKYNVKAFNKLDMLLQNVDAVSIASSTVTHYNIAIECLKRNIHILLEKPMVENLEQAEKLINLYRTQNVILQIGFIERFNPLIKVLVEIISNYTVDYIEIKRLSKNSRIKDCDVIQDLLIHDIDIVNYCINENVHIINTYGYINKQNGMIDEVIVNMMTTSGIKVLLSASRISDIVIRNIEIRDKNDLFIIDLLENKVTSTKEINSKYLNKGKRDVDMFTYRLKEGINPLMIEICSFINSVGNNTIPNVSIIDGFKASEIVDSIQKCIYNQNKY